MLATISKPDTDTDTDTRARACPDSGNATEATQFQPVALNKRAPPVTDTHFSHVKPGDTPWRADGLRDFFEYRDLGIKGATNGKVIAHLVRAKRAPVEGTGWHFHVAEFQMVLMTKGWARFMYEDKVTRVEAGDCVHQRPGMAHYLFDYSPDMEYLEVVSPADFGSVDTDAAGDVPPPTAWPA